MVGGGIQLETATLDDSSLTDDAIILESGTTTQLESFNIQSESNVVIVLEVMVKLLRLL